MLRHINAALCHPAVWRASGGQLRRVSYCEFSRAAAVAEEIVSAVRNELISLKRQNQEQSRDDGVQGPEPE